MTDTTLRELERRFRASGREEEEAAWLRARLQSGTVSVLGLELASQLGYPPAASLPLDSLQRTSSWMADLLGFGRSLPVRVHRGPVIDCIFHGEDWATKAEIQAIRASITQRSLGQTWVKHGQEAVIRAGLALLHQDPDCALTLYPGIGTEHVELVETALVENRFPELGDPYPFVRLFPLDGGQFCGHGFAGNSYPWLQIIQGCAERLGEKVARDSVRDELVPWALHYRDPLVERVAARKRQAHDG